MIKLKDILLESPPYASAHTVKTITPQQTADLETKLDVPMDDEGRKEKFEKAWASLVKRGKAKPSEKDRVMQKYLDTMARINPDDLKDKSATKDKKADGGSSDVDMDQLMSLL